MRIKIDSTRRHADLAMQAARRMARARRVSQKAKMGHVVCHHLLQMLSDDAGLPGRYPGDSSRQPSVTAAKSLEDRQFPLGF